MKTRFYFIIIMFFSLETTSMENLFGQDSYESQEKLIEQIQNICFAYPDSANQILHRAKTEKKYPSYLLNYLHCAIYHNGYGMYKVALSYGEKALKDKNISTKPYVLLSLYDMMMEEYRTNGEYTQSIGYALKGIDLARQLDEKSMEGNMILSIGTIKWEMGLKEDAEKYFAQAIEKLKECAHGSSEWEKVDNLIYCYGTIINCAWEDKQYQRAIKLLPDYEKTMKQLENCNDLPEGVIDMRYASEYACYACIFTESEDFAGGKQYYQKYLQTDYAKTPEGEAIGIQYLLAAKRYEEALLRIRQNKEYAIAQADTISSDYIDYVLKPEAQACEAIGDKQRAIDVYRQIKILTDSLNARERKNAALELATIYETNEKEALLQQNLYDLEIRNAVILFFIVSILLLAVLLWRIIRHAHIIRNKNSVMIQRIEELYQCEEQLYQAQKKISLLMQEHDQPLQPESPEKETALSPKEAIQESFEKLNRIVIEQRLYLNPDITRQDLLSASNLNKNQISSVLNQSGFNLKGYLNDLRIRHATGILKEHPEYTIEGVARLSGFNTMGTFYTAFKKVMGLTPAEYKNTIIRLKTNT